MASEDPFSSLDAEGLDRLALKHGFKRRRKRNWVRRTADFIQLINLQRSQWSPEERYLNFALWPLAMGEPPTVAESKFHFRTRGASMGAADINGVFKCANALTTLAELKAAEASGRISGLMTRQLRELLSSA